MTKFFKSQDETKEGFIFIYTNVTKSELDKQVDELLKSIGYKISSGNLGNATYTKGNYTMRILFGAFVKYFQLAILTKEENGELKLMLTKKSTGISGGAIGMNQVKKELQKLTELFKTI